MPETVFGMPTHPLVVHLPVVLVPLLAAAALGYVLVSRFRRPLGWVLVALSVVAPAVAVAAKLTGEALARERLASLASAPEAAAATETLVDEHSGYGDTLVWLLVVLAVSVWLFVAVASGRLASLAERRSWTWSDRFTRPGPVRLYGGAALGAVVVASALGAGWFVVRAGHTGAAMIWGG